jgi:hypothetical protein
MEKGEKIYKNLRNAVTTIINKEKGLVFYNGLLISLIVKNIIIKGYNTLSWHWIFNL